MIQILMTLGNTGRGGSQSFVMNVVRNINREKYSIDLAVYNDPVNGYGNEFRELGCRIHIVPKFNGGNYRRCTAAWRKLLAENNYDIVHGNATNAAYLYLKIAKLNGIKTIIHSHSSGFRGNLVERTVKSFFSKKGKKYADYWFSCSDVAAKKLFGEEYKDYAQYRVIPNAINVENYLFDEKKRVSIRRSLGINREDVLYGHIGSFSMPKNHTFLLEIFKEIVQVNPAAKLVLCGGGPLEATIKAYIAELSLGEHVIMTGNVPNVSDYMMAMDVMIFPSLFEGFPVSVIEAQSTGLPVVMSDVITSEVDLTECVHRMSLNDSPKEWARSVMGIRASDRQSYNKIISGSNYNVSTSIKQLESLYDEMVK